MAYATLDDMTGRYGRDELAQRADPAETGTPDPAIIGRLLADASEVVDAYAAARYRLPLSPVPGPVVRLTCDIARYLLWSDAASERVRQGYEDALKDLERVCKGIMRLECAGLEAAPAPDGDLSVAFDPGTPPALTRRTMGGW